MQFASGKLLQDIKKIHSIYTSCFVRCINPLHRRADYCNKCQINYVFMTHFQLPVNVETYLHRNLKRPFQYHIHSDVSSWVKNLLHIQRVKDCCFVENCVLNICLNCFILKYRSYGINN